MKKVQDVCKKYCEDECLGCKYYDKEADCCSFTWCFSYDLAPWEWELDFLPKECK